MTFRKKRKNNPLMQANALLDFASKQIKLNRVFSKVHMAKSARS